MVKPADIRVLVVDDDPDILEMISRLFVRFGFSTVTASSGNKAWDILQKDTNISIVISDIRMPDGDGVELLKRIRAKSVGFPKFLVISGFSDFSPGALLGMGADGFFPKPFSATAVRDAVTRVFLKPSERWARTPSANPIIQINKKLVSIEKATQSGEVIFGRGGFAVQTKFDPPPDDSWVSFSIDFNDGRPFKGFTGMGQIKWSYRPTADGPTYLGIDIAFLENDGPAQYDAAFGKQISSIPYPPGERHSA